MISIEELIGMKRYSICDFCGMKILRLQQQITKLVIVGFVRGL